MTRITRRQALRGSGGLLAVGLAGCSGGGDDTPSDDDQSTSGNDEENDGENDTPSNDDQSTTSGNGQGSGSTTESLAVGESYTNPIGNTITVTDIELRDSIEAESRLSDGEFYEKEAEDGEQWAVVSVEVANESGQTQYLTPAFQITARANGSEYNRSTINNDEETYNPAEVADGESRDGWLVYGVPAELTLAGIEVVHSNSADGESWTVTWSED